MIFASFPLSSKTAPGWLQGHPGQKRRRTAGGKLRGPPGEREFYSRTDRLRTSRRWFTSWKCSSTAA